MRDYNAIIAVAEKAMRDAIGTPGPESPEQVSHMVALAIAAAMQEQERQDNA